MKKSFTAEARWIEDRKYWKISVQDSGKRKSFYSKEPGKKGKKEAEAKAREWYDNGAYDDPIFSEAWKAFLVYKKARLVFGTYRTYERVGRTKLLPQIGNKRLDRIKWKTLQTIVDNASAEHESSGQAITGILSEFAKWCVKMDYPQDILNKLEAPKHTRKKQKRALTVEELRTLFSVDQYSVYRKSFSRKAWYINMFRLCAICGLRRGEALGLKWAEIKDGAITINRSIEDGYISEGKTAAARRKIILPDHAFDVLNAQKEMLKESNIISPWVFPNKKGGVSAACEAYSEWKAYLKGNGMDTGLSLHQLRHTAVSMYIEHMSMDTLKAVVGHSASMDTSGIYGHDFNGKLQRAAHDMDSVLSDILK